MKLTWAFKKKFPFTSEWLELQVARVNRLPEKVQRRNVPRGELYPLARKKTLVALLKSVGATADWKLDDIAQLSGVSYSSIGHWSKEKRVLQKSYAFAQDFINKLLEEILTMDNALTMDGSQGWPMASPEEWVKLREEVTHFQGLIFILLFKKLEELIKSNKPLSSRLFEFINHLLINARPDFSYSLKRLFKLEHEARNKEWEHLFNSLKDQISTDPEGAILHIENRLKPLFFGITHELAYTQIRAVDYIIKGRKSKIKKSRKAKKGREPKIIL